MLIFDQVDYAYKTGQNVISDLSFNVQPKEFISIIGSSGSGKSTIFRLVTGLAEPQSGSIVLEGHNKNRLGQVGYMPQQDLLLPWRTVMENACLPLEIAGTEKKEAQQRVLSLLHEFGLHGTEHKYPAQLSGGMKQRVAFLRAVLSGNSLLLLDEPFSSLDAITKYSMQEWLMEQWKKWNATILFITHDVEEALFLSDRIFLITPQSASFFKEITVPLDRPRTRSDLNHPDILSLKEQLLGTLRNGAGV